jgi:hypothetical protein
MIDTDVQLYGEKPRKASSPLEQNDHPEMDDSPFLGQDETQQFQSLIGAMQWAVSIGRLDIATAVMSLSSFRAMPRRGHLKRAKRIYGYLRKMKEARIRVLTNEPDYSDYQDPEYDWSSSVYGDVKEIIPADIPEPKGKYVTLSHYFDANLYHDMVTGRLPYVGICITQSICNKLSEHGITDRPNQQHFCGIVWWIDRTRWCLGPLSNRILVGNVS